MYSSPHTPLSASSRAKMRWQPSTSKPSPSVAATASVVFPWPDALGQRYLGTEQLIFCASPGYLARRGTPRSLEELWTHAAVTYGRASPWLIPHGAAPVERRAVEWRIVVGQADARLSTSMIWLSVKRDFFMVEILL